MLAKIWEKIEYLHDILCKSFQGCSGNQISKTTKLCMSRLTGMKKPVFCFKWTYLHCLFKWLNSVIILIIFYKMETRRAYREVFPEVLQMELKVPCKQRTLQLMNSNAVLRSMEYDKIKNKMNADIQKLKRKLKE